MNFTPQGHQELTGHQRVEDTPAARNGSQAPAIDIPTHERRIKLIHDCTKVMKSYEHQALISRADRPKRGVLKELVAEPAGLDEG
jgi:hypothetical protein